ncbi:hypothetical protein [Bradyrhizobium elkanii]|uniref:hypothetical protein n=1 Tax=Bradyrhizobium elkanii TaxID=29448 RepID=UPI00148527B9|nr:hypothetical protein [Bradyrhizobium elkanii]
MDAVQWPLQPSDRTNEPEPLRPEKRPELVQLKPPADPLPVVDPLGLTCPELSSPEIAPPDITNLSVLEPQGEPWATTTHEPSKLPPPSLLVFLAARRGASELLLCAGLDGVTVRGAVRVPDSDFSSLPILPPLLPDCASAAVDPSAAMSSAESSMGRGSR